jgi:hypothetical protein
MGYYDMDSNNQQQGVIDNVIVWDYAKTNFAHWLDESACTQPLPAPLLASPVSGEEDVSLTPTLTWQAAPGALSYHLSLYDDEFNTIVDQAQFTTTYFNVPAGKLLEGMMYHWHVRAVNGCGEDGEKPLQFNFTTLSSDSPGLMVISPNGGDFLAWGTTHEIRWNYSGSPGVYVKIEYNAGGRRWMTIVPNALCADKSYMWTVPTIDSDTCRVRITAVNDTSVTDISDSNFRIGEYKRFDHTACDGGHRYWFDSRNIVTALAQRCTAPANVILSRHTDFSHGESCSGKGCIYHDCSRCYASYCEEDQCKVSDENCTIIEPCEIVGYCTYNDHMYCAECDATCRLVWPFGAYNARCGAGCIRTPNCP